MKLDLQKLKEITFGTQIIIEKDGYFFFNRFLENQANCYLSKNPDLFIKTRATASIRFSLITDADSISFDYDTDSGSSREFANVDVFENDILTGHYDLTIDKKDSFNHNFSKGEKKVEIYFPWSRQLFIKNIVLENATFINAKSRKLKSLAFGDSITQGYDAIYPSNTYMNIFSKQLDSDVINLAIGADVHFIDIVENMPTLSVDYITVAYGTNDWSKLKYEDFLSRCKDFYKALTQKFGGVKIFTILPIWRKEESSPSIEGYYLDDYRNKIIEITKEYDNIIVVGGKNLLPHDTELYSDKRLHPNDEGFKLYAKNLLEQVEKHL